MITADVRIYRRNSKTIPLRIKGANGVYYPINAYQATFMMKVLSTDADADALIVKRTLGHPAGGGGDDQIKILDDGTDKTVGSLEVYIWPSETDLEGKLYPFEIEVSNESVSPPKRDTVFRGYIEIVDTLIKEA